MASQSIKDVRRYLQAFSGIIHEDDNVFQTSVNGKTITIIAHAGESLFDTIPVDPIVFKRTNCVYAVSHKDGNIYIATTIGLSKKEYTTIGGLLHYQKECFTNIQKFIPNTSNAGKFVHLHSHGVHSLADGMAKSSDYARLCKQLGFPAMAITDHGTMAGIIDFYKECKEFGVKPILGQEFYMDYDRHAKGAPKSYTEKLKKENVPKEQAKDLVKEYCALNRINKRFHLVLLAKNEVGLKNLFQLSSLAYLEGFYYKPRIDWELLERYSEGVIASTACLGGIISGEKDPLRQEDHLRRLVEIFGKEDVYLEVMLSKFDEQPDANTRIFDLSVQYGITPICTFDSHYTHPDPDGLHHLYMKIGSGYTYGEGDNYLKTYNEVKKTFDDYFSGDKYGWDAYETAMHNTLAVADKCNVELELGKFKIPIFNLATALGYQIGDDAITYFKRRIGEGWKQKIQGKLPVEKQSEYMERLKYELKVFVDAGYVDYMLIVLDMVDYAKMNNIIHNVRGSAAGSLVCYLLDLSRIDPMEHDLMFERFVSPLRAGTVVYEPDFD